MNFDWLNMFTLFGIAQALLVILMISVKKRYNLHKTFAWILIILGLMQLESLLLRSDYFHHFLHISNTTGPLVFLLGPLLLLYTHTLMGKRWSLYSMILHLAVFLFYLGYSFTFFLKPWQLKYIAVVSSHSYDLDKINVLRPFGADPWNIRDVVVAELITLHLLVYAFITLATLKRWKHYFKNHNFEHYLWLRFLGLLFIFGALALFFSKDGVINDHTFFKSPFAGYSMDLVITTVIYVLMIYLIVSPNTLMAGTKKYKTSTLPTLYKRKKLSTLISVMEDGKLYMDANFSLRILAEKSGISTHHISQILNEELRVSFFELTNDYRIKEAKRRLENPDGYIKIEQLAYDLGYKSKSTFFKAFKKATGLTPFQYRNR